MDLDRKEEGVENHSEPTVWDWFVSILRLKPIPIPAESDYPSIEVDQKQVEVPTFISEVELVEEVDPATHLSGSVPSKTTKWIRFPAALFFALFAQLALDSKPERALLPVLLYIGAFILMGWAVWAGDFRFSKPHDRVIPVKDQEVRLSYVLFGAGLTVFTFFLTRSNTFNFLNLSVWGAGLIAFLMAFWQGETPLQRFRNWLQTRRMEGLNFHVGRFEILFTVSLLVILFFRVSKLDSVPTDMWSDQAEKLLDVFDILEGKFSIFFPRNTGREGLQMYIAAGTAALLGTGVSFMTLKIGTVITGLVTLPFIYLFAKEYGGRYIGLSAMFMAGVAHWPNILSRLGLRFPLYPLFVAPALFFLVKGLRTKNRNDFLLMGLAIGLGLHGYSPARVIPLAVALGAVIYLLHTKVKPNRKQVISWTVMAGVIAFVVFTPLLGAIVEMPDLYFFRMMSRIGTAERAYPGSPITILLDNLWDGLRMFGWDNGELWVVSVPNRPALDWVTGAFFHLGAVLILVRYLRNRDWKDLFLLLSVPILILPSILSLAFPGENPAPNRASGAIVPVFTIAATAFTLLPAWVKEIWKDDRSKFVAIGVYALLVPLILVGNYNLVFNEYARQQREKTWNTREVGEYIKGFATTVGDYDTAHVIATAHWLDGRLVAMIAGADPRIDYSIWPEELSELKDENRPQLFILKPEDEIAKENLAQIFPQGILSRVESEVTGHDFMIYFVPSGDVHEYPTNGMDP